MKILIVDDNEENIYMLQSLLQGAGHEVFPARNGMEALDVLKSSSAELIISDILMPKMDGFQLCRAVRETEDIAGIPFAFYTATYTSDEDRDFALNLGADWFFVKPDDLEQLVKTIRDDIPGHISAAERPLGDEMEFFRQYNKVLFRKLEKKVVDLEGATRTLEASLQQMSAILNNIPDIAWLKDTESRYIAVNEPFGAACGRNHRYLAGKKDPDIWPQDLASLYRRDDQEVMRTKQRKRVEERLIGPDGKETWLETIKTPVFGLDGAVIGSTGIARDITERKRADERIQRQIRKLSALHSIDLAVSSSLDIHMTLKVFIAHAVAELGVDAADILLLNPHTSKLEYAANQGFMTDALQHSSLRLGEGYAGVAALENRIVSIPNLKEDGKGFEKSVLLDGENFMSYYGVPLVAKGHVKGVLEIFNRRPLTPDAEWLEFLDALALQAAIAIDNSSLFYNLERSNMALLLAYDSTIEGWSRALDYRDQETEGHSQRVTEMTVGISREMGMNEEELVHVRRGALLHDIGKLGIPDSILLKKGPLTDEEWKIMRLHPVYSFELLYPISYLRPALDIPHCHHEKWDGTGYPKGLKGDQIPLSARIFTVVDVWDALRSDRPYRSAWSEEKARDYIHSLSGIQFEPKVVDTFFKIK